MDLKTYLKIAIPSICIWTAFFVFIQKYTNETKKINIVNKVNK